jgi:hypothetical protein
MINEEQEGAGPTAISGKSAQKSPDPPGPVN